MRCEEKGGESNDLLADRAPTAADPPTPPPTPIRTQPPSGWYWVAGILAVLGLTAALVWGAVGTISALDEVDSFERTTVPGAVTVPVTDPGTMVVYYENPAELARYATTPRPGSSSGSQ